MRQTCRKWLSIAPVAILAFAGPALAYDQIVLARGWERVAADGSDQCEAEVGSNGKFYIIAVYGLQPGERARFHLANEDIRPIERRITADGGGHWSNYYLPFLWNHTGGTVDILIESESCQLSLTFDWERTQGTL